MNTAGVEQYSFGDCKAKAKVVVEADCNADGTPDIDSGWRVLYNGPNAFEVTGLKAPRWRLRLILDATDAAASPRIRNVIVTPGR